MKSYTFTVCYILAAIYKIDSHCLTELSVETHLKCKHIDFGSLTSLHLLEEYINFNVIPQIIITYINLPSILVL